MIQKKRTIQASARTGIALPIIRADGVDYDLSKLDREELGELKIAVETSMADVDLQIENAATRFSLTGEQADPVWFNSLRNVRRLMNLQIQAIMAEQRKRKQENKGKHSIEWYFVRVARESLGPQTFNTIWREAERRHDEPQSPLSDP